MLVAEGNLQVVDGLAVALKAEMSRLDDARMDRPDGDFMDFFAGHLEEVGRAAGSRRWKANRLQPRMAEGFDVALLKNLTLVEMCLRAIWGERLILSADIGGDDRNFPFVGPSQGGEQPKRARSRIERIREKRGKPATGRDAVHDFATEGLHGQQRAIRQRKCVAVMDEKTLGGGHQLTPKAATAWRSKWVSGGGT